MARKRHNDWNVGARKKKTYNVLILGETGVGKSTFINSLANYLCFDTFDVARENGPVVLIKSDFSVRDNNGGNFEVVKVDATVKRDQAYAQDEDTTAGNSATQITQTYLVEIPGSGLTIRLIDTPGVGDSRGLEQDKKNFQTVLDCIGQLDEINAILVLMKPTTARETLTFRFCIDELLTNLHKSAADNILFCFTNSGGSQRFTPGESIGPLEKHLEKIKRQNGTVIDLNDDRIYCFDNTPFRFMCEERKKRKESYANRAWNYLTGSKSSTGSEAMATTCWEHSQSEARRMVKHIVNLAPHATGATACLNEVRQTIIMLAKPLAEISKNQAANMKLIEDKRIEIKRRQEEGEEMKGQLYLEQAMLNPIELDYPRTVCTAANCVERKKLRPTDAMEQIIYKTVCHSHCGLSGVQVENCPNEMLKGCWAMTHREGQIACRGCGCLWSTHMHIRYRLETTFERVENSSIKSNIDSAAKEIDAVKNFLAELEKTEKKLQAEQAELRTACAELAMFLNKNSMVAYNDSYGQYLDHQIREEENLKRLTGKSDILERLKANKQEYEQEVLLIKQNVGGHRTIPSITEVQQIIQRLRKMEKIGAMIVRFENVTKSALRTETTRADLVVPVSETREQARRTKERLERERAMEETKERENLRQQQAQEYEDEQRRLKEKEHLKHETAMTSELQGVQDAHSRELQALNDQLEQFRLEKELKKQQKEDRRRQKEEELKRQERELEEKKRQEEEERRKQEELDKIERLRIREEELSQKEAKLEEMMKKFEEKMQQPPVQQPVQSGADPQIGNNRDLRGFEAYPQAGYPQGGYPQRGFPQEGHPQGGYPPAVYPQAYYPNRYDHPGYGYPPNYNNPRYGPGYNEYYDRLEDGFHGGRRTNFPPRRPDDFYDDDDMESNRSAPRRDYEQYPERRDPRSDERFFPNRRQDEESREDDRESNRSGSQRMSSGYGDSYHQRAPGNQGYFQDRRAADDFYRDGRQSYRGGPQQPGEYDDYGRGYVRGREESREFGIRRSKSVARDRDPPRTDNGYLNREEERRQNDYAAMRKIPDQSSENPYEPGILGGQQDDSTMSSNRQVPPKSREFSSGDVGRNQEAQRRESGRQPPRGNADDFVSRWAEKTAEMVQEQNLPAKLPSDDGMEVNNTTAPPYPPRRTFVSQVASNQKPYGPPPGISSRPPPKSSGAAASTDDSEEPKKTSMRF